MVPNGWVTLGMPLFSANFNSGKRVSLCRNPLTSKITYAGGDEPTSWMGDHANIYIPWKSDYCFLIFFRKDYCFSSRGVLSSTIPGDCSLSILWLRAPLKPTCLSVLWWITWSLGGQNLYFPCCMVLGTHCVCMNDYWCYSVSCCPFRDRLKASFKNTEVHSNLQGCIRTWSQGIDETQQTWVESIWIRLIFGLCLVWDDQNPLN